MLPKMDMNELNCELSTINRVVVHPKYRTIGLGAKLIHDTLPLVGTPSVELIAVMAKYSPFAEKAGLTKIAVQEPGRDVLRVANALSGLGFDLKLLGSQKYVLSSLQNLSQEQLTQLKEVFVKNPHLRFKREIDALRHMPYGTAAVYAEGVRNASIERIAKLIKIVGMLLQTKVYLFWQHTNKRHSKMKFIR
jgi:hypothetical protein